MQVPRGSGRADRSARRPQGSIDSIAVTANIVRAVDRRHIVLLVVRLGAGGRCRMVEPPGHADRLAEWQGLGIRAGRIGVQLEKRVLNGTVLRDQEPQGPIEP